MKALHKWMRATGTTQMVLAKRVGVAQGTISDWLNGFTEPGFKKLIKLSRITGVSIDDMVRSRVESIRQPRQSTAAAANSDSMPDAG